MHSYCVTSSLIFLSFSFIICTPFEIEDIFYSGEIHMSPGVLAAMWKEEENKSRLLEEKMKILLTNKGVCYTLQ